MKIHQEDQPKKIYRAARLVGVLILAFTAVAILMLGLGTQQAAMANGIAVGLIPTELGVLDDGYNYLAHQGLLRAESQLGVVGTVYTPTNPEDYEAQLKQCVDDGNHLCIAVGFWFSDTLMNAANTYTETDFAGIDHFYEDYPDNLRGTHFDEKEAGYLAGVLAGHMTQGDVIGAVAGWPVPPVVAFAEGYQNGAQCSNPAVKVMIEYILNWNDPELGAQHAQVMMAQGADAIFAIGGTTGIGAVMTATQSGAWGIGVDTDFYVTVFENGAVDGSDKVLSSALKKIDNAVYSTISDVVSDTFTSGTFLYNLAEDGVGLAPFHEADSSVPQSVRDALADVEQGIIDGSIDIDSTCRVNLPLTIR